MEIKSSMRNSFQSFNFQNHVHQIHQYRVVHIGEKLRVDGELIETGDRSQALIKGRPAKLLIPFPKGERSQPESRHEK